MLAKVTNSFQIDTSVSTTILIGARDTLGYFHKWPNWAGKLPEISVLPAKETYIVIYLLNLFQICKSYSTIPLTYQAINYFHSIVGHPKPCNSEFCLNILRGNVLLDIQSKKNVIVKHLYKFYSHFRGKCMSLAMLRTTLTCAFSFMGFLHFREIINIRRTDFVIKNTQITIFFEKSKTDVYRERSWVYLTELSLVLCPICLFTRYCRLADIKKRFTKYIFRAITTTRNISIL